MSTEASSQAAAAAENAAGENAAGEKKRRRKRRWEMLVEVVEEVLVRAIVAVATPWSGYAAARWDGQQSLLYGHASADRFKADAASTKGGQELVADSSMFTAYLQAHSAAVRVTTTTIALALAGYTTVAMLALPRV